MTILDRIVEKKKEEIIFSKKQTSIDELKDKRFFYSPTYSLRDSVVKRSGIIAEFKRKSPSKGVINAHVAPLEVVSAYQEFGASGISILTDSFFFGGSFDDVLSVRNQINIPILRKDFMIDSYQFYEAKSIGADVVLLIAACLSPAQVAEFTDLAHELNMEVLLEIHTEEELNHFNNRIDFVGINNRNLKNFKVDLDNAVRLKNALPTGTLTVAESGIYSLEDFKYLKNKQFDAFLMGEFFMKALEPATEFRTFMQSIT